MDGHGVTLRGPSAYGAARLVWGYRTAAELGVWTIVKRAKGWSLRAALTSQDAYQLRQRPLLLLVPRERGFWTWPVEGLTVQPPGRAIVATLGAPVQG